MIRSPFTDIEIQEGGLLLHTCCGPCAEYPLYDLKQRSIIPTFYYMNPNIHPQEEWRKRYESLEKLAKMHEINLFVNHSYSEEDWAHLGKSPERCHFCYSIRMNDVALKAKELDLAFFTSSLLVSPYQNYEALIAAGSRAAKKYDVTFLAEDWRDHFREGQEMARKDGLYRQKYCGCILSLGESNFKEKIMLQHEEFEAQKTSPVPKAVSYR